ncbi:unnamed protein product [Cochlearia groenlandica]
MIDLQPWQRSRKKRSRPLKPAGRSPGSVWWSIGFSKGPRTSYMPWSPCHAQRTIEKKKKKASRGGR